MKHKPLSLAKRIEMVSNRVASLAEHANGQASYIVMIADHLATSEKGGIDDNWIQGAMQHGLWPEFDAEDDDDCPDYEVEAGSYHPLIVQYLRTAAVTLFNEVEDTEDSRLAIVRELEGLQREALLVGNGCVVCKRHLEHVIACTLTRCGLVCDGQCLRIHLRQCGDCRSREALAEVPAGHRAAYVEALRANLLPGMEDVPEARAAAAAAAQGESLTLDLFQPLPSISATSGAMEKHSPLFCESAANPQLSLF